MEKSPPFWTAIWKEFIGCFFLSYLPISNCFYNRSLCKYYFIRKIWAKVSGFVWITPFNLLFANINTFNEWAFYANTCFFFHCIKYAEMGHSLRKMYCIFDHYTNNDSTNLLNFESRKAFFISLAMSLFFTCAILLFIAWKIMEK